MIKKTSVSIDSKTDTASLTKSVSRHGKIVDTTEFLEKNNLNITEQIFRANDIRGIVGKFINEDIAKLIGQAIGSEAADRGQQRVLVGFDGRERSPSLANALIEGLVASGRHVTNIGLVPTPVLYFGTRTTNIRSGVMITGSHNGPNYNGFKIVLDGQITMGPDIKNLHERIDSGRLVNGKGSVEISNLKENYLNAITENIVISRRLKIVLDCSNGAASVIAPDLFRAMGCSVVPLYCDVDGTFPNHMPDPTQPENLNDLILAVKLNKADIGVALDGDGDRLVAITPEGEIIWPDRLLMLLAKDIISRNPGSNVVYDIKCSQHLKKAIVSIGGRPIICRSGHAYVKQKMKETEAVLGGELSGHVCIAERWYGFDDGIYSAARIAEILSSKEDDLTELLEEFPKSYSTPEIYVDVAEEEKITLLKKFTEAADFEDAIVTSIDGFRVDFEYGWGLVRASNTQPALNLRFEADNIAALENIKTTFREILKGIREDLDFK